MKRLYLINFLFPISLVVLLLISGCGITTKTANEVLPYLEPLNEDNQPISFSLPGHDLNALKSRASHSAVGMDEHYRYEFTVYEVDDYDPAINGVHVAIRSQVGSKKKGEPTVMNFFDPKLDVYQIKSVKAAGNVLKVQVEEEYYLDVEGEGLTLKRDADYGFEYDVAKDFLYIVK